MFGAYRYVLAIMVVACHLRLSYHLGPYAVFAFYVLSGYLMTLVLNETYGFSRKGIARYLTNRALRIYPPYLAIALIAAVVILAAPEATQNLNPKLQIPQSLIGWIRNLAIFGIRNERL